MVDGLQHLKTRKQDQSAQFLTTLASWDLWGPPIASVLLRSPSDEGVVRNGGRRGARLAPKAIAACLQKMARPPHDPVPITQLSLDNQARQREDFAPAQANAAEEVGGLLQQHFPPRLAHLGGGHDHAYVLLKALEKTHPRKITVINLDAHLDTRADSQAHSGTPFRQFGEDSSVPFEIWQVGIQDYANPAANFAPLGAGRGHHSQMAILSYQQLLERLQAPPFQDDELVALSLDCDGLDGTQMEGVSAVNPFGLSKQQVHQVFCYYQALPLAHKIIGLYEYNPVYDNLSQKGAKFLAHLLWHFFFSKDSVGPEL